MSDTETERDTIVIGEGNHVLLEGYISGTPKPGSCVQVKAGVAPIGGRLTYEPFNRAADGARAAILLLVEDAYQGKGIADAYADGDRCFMVAPVVGEEYLVLCADAETGTGDSYDVGDRLMLEDGTGKFIAATGSVAEPFEVTEDSGAISEDTHVLARYTGVC